MMRRFILAAATLTFPLSAFAQIQPSPGQRDCVQCVSVQSRSVQSDPVQSGCVQCGCVQCGCVQCGSTQTGGIQNAGPGQNSLDLVPLTSGSPNPRAR